jgi:hypothetical protein
VFDLVGDTLKTLLEGQIAGLTVGFEVPNDEWRKHVAQVGGNWLNLYLVDLRDNRRLRSNELFDEWQSGQRVTRPAPARLDCYYAASAWTPAGIRPTPLVEATVEENVVLYEVTRVLMHNSPLDVGAIYGGPGPLPAELIEQPLPTAVAPPEGFTKLPDFWNRMEWFWKPVVELVITLPVAARAAAAAPPLITLFADFLPKGEPLSREEQVIIGGVVRAGTPPVPVRGAWVRLVELGRTTATDQLGRFVFANVPRGTYRLEAGALGYAVPATRTVYVPSLSGEYDVALV